MIPAEVMMSMLLNSDGSRDELSELPPRDPVRPGAASVQPEDREIPEVGN